MNVEFITKEDLYVFKKELLEDILAALKQQSQKSSKWLKSIEVRKILNVSPNTLQRLRIKGVLKFSRVGSTFYYKAEDVQKMLEGKNAR